ncbi:DNA polymerase III subunit beta [Candidatus Falkowbacteria bacterium CG11_big_fil_rev_8_21_14_0_20_39_10]|uniref:Beta sliding clamp n=1 Tax=Candidatus Falkowbacteria bacterium CG11_big_fil_rev_8_21_14_0_20_39_10 TaxID=1974570 RepID=A0A2M6K9E1_9BACT|nr:MAG: DNA polymerase III subunit beta [Candidatus Falkowbacteria bacterium CG11_big_fil_rev_8_21_14_0_20_39_10]
MKFSTLQENLKHGLFVVGHIAGKNINLPILNNIMIEARKEKIKLVATNLEIGVVHNLRGKTEEEGAFTVDSKIITDYINLVPNKKVEITLKTTDLDIKCENYKTKIKGQSAEEYPLIPQVDKNNFYSAKINEFKKALAQVVFAVSTSESRMELSGVFFGFNNGHLTLVATDSYRLAEKSVVIKSNNKEKNSQSIIIPARTLQELIRILSGFKDGVDTGAGAEEIKFYVSDNQILFEIDSTELVSRLIEGQYPDYKQIIPSSPRTTITINRQELVRAVKASALFSKTGINDVNLDFPQGKNQVIVSSASGQTGESITTIEASAKGDDNSMIVNYSYLLDGLNNIETENVKIEVIDNNTPCILRPEKGDDYLYIIMPIKQ